MTSTECLTLLVVSSEEQLRYVLTEYLQYYYHERIHPGLGRITAPQQEGNQGEIIYIERLGGLLKSYHREAAEATEICATCDGDSMRRQQYSVSQMPDYD